MASRCYAIVRGSAIRVTELGRRGQVTDPVRSVASKTVAKVTISEVTEKGNSEIVRSPEEKRRLRLAVPDIFIRHTVSIDFLRVDPGVLSLVAGVPLVRNAAGDIVGFDSTSRLKAVAFGLEVWSKLENSVCAETGEREWGYTVMPYLRGGILTGFTFANGLVSFNLTKAQSRRSSRWGVGPHDLTGPFQRLTSVVSGNLSFRMFVTTAPPPVQTNGIVERQDIISNGNAANPMPYPDAPLVVSGGNAASTSLWIIDGGQA